MRAGREWAESRHIVRHGRGGWRPNADAHHVTTQRNTQSPPKRSLQKGGANEPVVRIQLVKDAGKDDATETIAIDVPTRLANWDRSGIEIWYHTRLRANATLQILLTQSREGAHGRCNPARGLMDHTDVTADQPHPPWPTRSGHNRREKKFFTSCESTDRLLTISGLTHHIRLSHSHTQRSHSSAAPWGSMQCSDTRHETHTFSPRHH